MKKERCKYNKTKNISWKINFVFVVSLFALVNCSVDDESKESGPDNYVREITEGMAAKIDSNQWQAFNYSAVLRNKQIIITGLDTMSHIISITLNDTISNNTYELNNHSMHWATYTPSSNDIYTTFGNAYAGGMVYLKEFNHDSMFISGSFIFYAYNSKLKKTITITQGSFQKMSITNEAVSSNTIKMKIDGTVFTSKSTNAVLTDEYIDISAANERGTTLNIKIYSRLKGNYLLNNLSLHKASINYLAGANDSIPYSTADGTTYGGMVILANPFTTDSLINGSFILTLYRNSDKKSIVITEGIINGVKIKP